MTTVLPLIAVIVTVLAGWALIKRYQTHMVLLFAGLAILICVALAGTGFLPKGVKPSGFWLFDIFATLKSIATKQSAGIGFLIMTAGGFAAYMDRIGAAKALVDVAVKPLAALKAPYLVLAFGYIIGQLLVIVIPSAAGLAMLLLVALFPILKAVGVSGAAAAAVIGTSAGMTFAPTAGTASLAAKVASLDPIIYLVQYQLPLAVPTLIVAAIAHYFVQRYYDNKGDDQVAEVVEVKKAEVPTGPTGMKNCHFGSCGGNHHRFIGNVFLHALSGINLGLFFHRNDSAGGKFGCGFVQQLFLAVGQYACFVDLRYPIKLVVNHDVGSQRKRSDFPVIGSIGPNSL